MEKINEKIITREFLEEEIEKFLENKKITYIDCDKWNGKEQYITSSMKNRGCAGKRLK